MEKYLELTKDEIVMGFVASCIEDVAKRLNEPNYGEFWVGNGPIENGRKKEILVGHERGSYGTNGAVTGWLNGNAGYNYTNSRRNCATVEKSYICFYMYPKGETMTVYYTCRGEYLKNGTPMFYQESNKVNGINYTKW